MGIRMLDQHILEGFPKVRCCSRAFCEVALFAPNWREP